MFRYLVKELTALFPIEDARRFRKLVTRSAEPVEQMAGLFASMTERDLKPLLACGRLSGIIAASSTTFSFEMASEFLVVEIVVLTTSCSLFTCEFVQIKTYA
jgi:hypothetical protein